MAPIKSTSQNLHAKIIFVGGILHILSTDQRIIYKGATFK